MFHIWSALPFFFRFLLHQTSIISGVSFLGFCHSPRPLPAHCLVQSHRLPLAQTTSFILMLRNLLRHLQLLFKNLTVKVAECLPRAECFKASLPSVLPTALWEWELVLSQFWGSYGARRFELNQGHTGGFVCRSVWLQSPWWRILVEKLSSDFQSQFSIYEWIRYLRHSIAVSVKWGSNNISHFVWRWVHDRSSTALLLTMLVVEHLPPPPANADLSFGR